MAIDTDTRKFSAMNVGCIWRGVNVIPSGALGEDEQTAILYLYNEFAAAAADGGGVGLDYLFGFSFGSP